VKRSIFGLATFLCCVSAMQAQTEPRCNKPNRADTNQVEVSGLSASEQIQSRVLPDNPTPLLPNLQQASAPCPAGVGKPCALLRGRLYFPDPLRMADRDKTLWKAATNPGMLAAYSLNLAATVTDAEGTQACLHAGTCTEADPIFGKKPSRARVYLTGAPLLLGSFAGAAWLKKRGKGNLAFTLLWASTMVHTYLAVQGFANANIQASPTPAPTTRQKFGFPVRL
jgi:hypothetical protein